MRRFIKRVRRYDAIGYIVLLKFGIHDSTIDDEERLIENHNQHIPSLLSCAAAVCLSCKNALAQISSGIWRQNAARSWRARESLVLIFCGIRVRYEIGKSVFFFTEFILRLGVNVLPSHWANAAVRADYNWGDVHSVGMRRQKKKHKITGYIPICCKIINVALMILRESQSNKT